MDGPEKISPEGDQAIHISFASHKKIKELRNTWLIEPAVSYKCSQCQQNDINPAITNAAARIPCTTHNAVFMI